MVFGTVETTTFCGLGIVHLLFTGCPINGQNQAKTLGKTAQNVGMFWGLSSGGHGSAWLSMAQQGSAVEAMAQQWRPWLSSGGHGSAVEAMAQQWRPWLSMAQHGSAVGPDYGN
jgi:hypothetical protein